MNKISKGIVFLFFCVLLAERISHADVETSEERLKELQEKVEDLEELKQLVQALKEELKREIQSRDEQVIALEERMEEAEPVFDIARTLTYSETQGSEIR